MLVVELLKGSRCDSTVTIMIALTVLPVVIVLDNDTVTLPSRNN